MNDRLPAEPRRVPAGGPRGEGSSGDASAGRRLRGLASRVSLAWLIPVAALLFALGVAWKNVSGRGPLVSILVDEAGGVVAGETRIRRNDVDVGRVEAVRLGENLDSVVIVARLDPAMAPYLDEDARFWIVNARVNTTEISGLSTLLSGVYIGVDWGDGGGERVDEFDGLAEPPLTKLDTPGRRLTLSADEAGYILVGSPVFYRQVEIGRVERRRLSDDATQVLFDIFIEAPFHEHVYPESSFYSVTGVEANVDAGGISVRLESIAAFFTGGIAFDNPENVAGTAPVDEDGAFFRLYDNQKASVEGRFEGESDDRFRYLARFSGSVKGLRREAPIEYNGIRVGRVVDVSVRLPSAPGDDASATAILELQPARLGLDAQDPDALLDALDLFVARGLRAQLASGNLLTGSLIVKLVDTGIADASVAIDRDALPYPALPATASNVEAVTADVEQLVSKLSELPLDELFATATGLLDDVRSLVRTPEIGALPGQLSASLGSIATTAGRIEAATDQLPALLKSLTAASGRADDVLDGLSPDSEIYIELSKAVRELRLAARSIADFAEVLERNPSSVFTGRR